MPAKLRLAYFAHSVRSDWNNGNAHFLRGLLRAMVHIGHEVTVFEPEHEWSLDNLKAEHLGSKSLSAFNATYSDLKIKTYHSAELDGDVWYQRLSDLDVVILHEWNPPSLSQLLLRLRPQLGFRLLFHDTHHRASSSPQQMAEFGLAAYDGVLAFGESLRNIYRDRFAISKVWVLHEAADTSVFYPRSEEPSQADVVWIGNWGEGERAAEINDFLLQPAALLKDDVRFTIYGVRYPADGLAALRDAHVKYAGYLPNLDAPCIYASAKLTLHVPRQQYTTAMIGIPTIRVFEALASGIPLISAPWQDKEGLFNADDYLLVQNTAEMINAIRQLLSDPAAARAQAARGLETIQARHTCSHRAEQLTAICEEVLR